MWFAVAAALAAEPTFPHREDPVAVARYARVDGDGPVRLRYKKSSGAIEGWSLPNGVVVRYRRFDGKRLAEDHRFDVTGLPVTTVSYGVDGPESVLVHGAKIATFPVTGWAEHTIDGVTLRAPGASIGDGFAWEGNVFRITRLDAVASPFSAEFEAGVVEACGCAVRDRSLTWVDGRRAARYLVSIPDITAPAVGELWAIPVDGGLWLASFVTPGADDDVARLAPGRAVVALIALEAP